MIERKYYLDKIKEVYEIHLICAILGPRQSGKTTLANIYTTLDDSVPIHYFDLEDPTDLAKLENPKLTLEPLKGLIVLDEIQRRPEIFPYLRVLVDRFKDKRILILGSASRDLIQQSSETLAGRIGYIELPPLNLVEVSGEVDLLWKRGGFPKSFLAPSDAASLRWRKDFISTFLERDIVNFGFDITPYDMRRLWTMVAHYHANILNYSEIGRSLSLSDNTIRKYIHLLKETFMIRLLKPWHVNIKKRQVKTPKIYVRDSGIFHALLDMNEANIVLDPKVGASWEGFALEEIIRLHDAQEHECYYWMTQNHAEVDLLIQKSGKLYAYEIKYSDSPKITKSMWSGIADLGLEKLTIVTPGESNFLLDEQIEVMGLRSLIKRI